jgi:hypothetical protein
VKSRKIKIWERSGNINMQIGRNRWLKSAEKRRYYAPQRQSGEMVNRGAGAILGRKAGESWARASRRKKQIGLQRRARSNYLIKVSRKRTRTAYFSFWSCKNPRVGKGRKPKGEKEGGRRWFVLWVVK